MVKDRVFKPEYAAELVRIATNDLKAAIVLKNDAGIRRETVFFMIQQSVEKALKALLCHLKKPVPMVHDLLLILDRLKKDAPKEAEYLVDLSDFAAIKRYEEGTFIPTLEELEATIEMAEKVVSHCHNIIITS